MECGTPQALACPTCSAPVTAGQKFCMECGTPLTASAPSSATSHAELRLVTVLFADLVSFTALSEHRDPEVVRDMLERYFERCRTIIGRYGGTVEKFIGDAVMAVWGSPVAREDDAERAVRAGLELVAMVKALGEEIGMPDLRVRAGLLTGETAVNVAAEHEGMVIGDAVNTASRIQSLAEPGTVCVDDGTRRATESAIAYEDAGTHTVKGRDQPVRVWKALRVIAGLGGVGRSTGLEAPFVGRAAELQAIIAAGDRVTNGKRAELVTVVGDAGMGKSRLAWEFEKHVDGIADGVFWHRGRCISYGEGVSFWALAEIVRARAGIAENEPAASARDKLRETVERYVTDERERRLVRPRLEHLLGLADGSSDAGDLFSGWRLFFERLADAEPVVMVFEDLQWADGGLLEFIDHLVEWGSESPILVLALGRPEVLGRRPGWEPHVHRLAPLDDAAMGDLLAGLVPGLPDRAVAEIRERAEGIPLYAVETVRMMLDRGVLEQQGEVYVVTGDIEDVKVPETLHALVASRLDDLTGAERRVVQDGSVLGATFTRDAVLALSDTPQRELQGALDSLVAKQILEVEDDPLSPEQGQYRFVQELIRTVAYSSLGRRDRKSRHLRVAEYLAGAWRDGAEDYAEVLATHYAEAVKAEPDAADAPQLRARARDTLTEAGRRAMSFGLGHEARGWFERAAEMAEVASERAVLLDRAGRGAVLAGDEDANELLERAAALHEEAGDPRAAAVSLGHLGAHFVHVGNTAEGIRILREVLATLGTEEVDGDVAFAAGELARLLMIEGDAAAGLEHIDTALVYAERTRALGPLADALVTRGTLLDMLGRCQEGLALIQHGLRMGEEANPRAVIRAYNNLVELLVRGAQYEEALSVGGKGVDYAELIGDRPLAAMMRVNLVRALVAVGRWDEAVGVLAAVTSPYESLACSNLMTVHVARGDEPAARSAHTALDRDDMSDVDVRAELATGRAVLALNDGDAERALDIVREPAEIVLDLALPLGPVYVLLDASIAAGRPEEGEAMIAKVLGTGAIFASDELSGRIAAFHGRVALARGDRDAAEVELERAVDRLRAAGTRFELAKGLNDLGALRADPAAIGEAQAIFAELGVAARLSDPLPA